MSGHGHFIWYELLTTDAAGAQAFYGDVVGWTFGSGDGPDGYTHLQAPDGEMVGGMMQLTPAMQQGGARPVWLGYLHVADVDASAAAIVHDGGAVRMPPTSMENVGRIAMVTDPSGAPFYIMTPQPPADRPEGESTAFSETAIGHCGWNELMTGDEHAALKFYGKHFGLVSPDRMSMGQMGDYHFLAHHHTTIGALMRAPEGHPAGWNYYFRVDDIDRAQTAITGGGGTVLNGPMEVPGGDWIIQGADPQGAAFCVVGARSS